MNRRQIRLTESDLHRIVTEAANKILNEVSAGLADRAASKAYQLARDGYGKYESPNEIPWDSPHGRKFKQAERFQSYVNDKFSDEDGNIGRYYPNGDDSVVVMKNYNTGEILTRPCKNLNDLEIEYNKYKSRNNAVTESIANEGFMGDMRDGIKRGAYQMTHRPEAMRDYDRRNAYSQRIRDDYAKERRQRIIKQGLAKEQGLDRESRNRRKMINQREGFNNYYH